MAIYQAKNLHLQNLTEATKNSKNNTANSNRLLTIANIHYFTMLSKFEIYSRN